MSKYTVKINRVEYHQLVVDDVEAENEQEAIEYVQENVELEWGGISIHNADEDYQAECEKE